MLSIPAIKLERTDTMGALKMIYPLMKRSITVTARTLQMKLDRTYAATCPRHEYHGYSNDSPTMHTGTNKIQKWTIFRFWENEKFKGLRRVCCEYMSQLDGNTTITHTDTYSTFHGECVARINLLINETIVRKYIHEFGFYYFDRQ